MRTARGILGVLAVLLAAPGCAPAPSVPGAATVATTAVERPPAAAPVPGPAPSTTAAAGVPPVPAGDDGVVTGVVDGDTIALGATRVRLIGIDTPETRDPRQPVQCFGPEAAARTKALLPVGTRVRLVYDVARLDRYGRTLAYVYRLGDGLFVNASLVAGGFAVADTVPPNVAHAGELVALEREARLANRGLWGGCPAEPAAPAPPPAAPLAGGGGGACEPSYPGVCIPPVPPDLDCGDVAARRFRVLPPDPHRFDADRDGIGCESG